MDNLHQIEADISLKFQIQGMDFVRAGEASSSIKHTLQRVGFKPSVIRRVAIATYEAEMNIVIHASEGTLEARIAPDYVEITASDMGPGITDIKLAMQEGFSTAPDYIREMGFGAGMGLPNIKNCSDLFEIDSQIGKGTRLRIVVRHQ